MINKLDTIKELPNKKKENEKPIDQLVLDFSIAKDYTDEDINRLEDQIKPEFKDDFRKLFENDSDKEKDRGVILLAINKMPLEDIKQILRTYYDGDSKHITSVHELNSIFTFIDDWIDEEENSKFHELKKYVMELDKQRSGYDTKEKLKLAA